jgi:hypothetical protein
MSTFIIIPTGACSRHDTLIYLGGEDEIQVSVSPQSTNRIKEELLDADCTVVDLRELPEDKAQA